MDWENVTDANLRIGKFQFVNLQVCQLRIREFANLRICLNGSFLVQCPNIMAMFVWVKRGWALGGYHISYSLNSLKGLYRR